MDVHVKHREGLRASRDRLNQRTMQEYHGVRIWVALRASAEGTLSLFERHKQIHFHYRQKFLYIYPNLMRTA